MPVDPWAPAAGSTHRHIVMADSDNAIQKIDESLLTQDGVTITAFWKSATLNRQDTAHYFTLSSLVLFYSAAAATTITVEATGDGGLNWVARNLGAGDSAPVDLAETGGEIRPVVIGFTVTGYDLRFKIEFDADVAAKVFGYRAKLVRRGLIDGNLYASS